MFLCALIALSVSTSQHNRTLSYHVPTYLFLSPLQQGAVQIAKVHVGYMVGTSHQSPTYLLTYSWHTGTVTTSNHLRRAKITLYDTISPSHRAHKPSTQSLKLDELWSISKAIVQSSLVAFSQHLLASTHCIGTGHVFSNCRLPHSHNPPLSRSSQSESIQSRKSHLST